MTTPTSTARTLVMGARDGIGRQLLSRFVDADLPVRASSRSPHGLAAGIDSVRADLTDPRSLHAAFDGVARAFIFANPHGVDGVIDAARAAGLERLVLLSSGSVLHPSSAGNVIAEEHRAVEEAFAAAPDLTVIPLRPLVLASNSLAWAEPIRRARSLDLYRPDAVTAPIHERDIADVAFAALTGALDPRLSDILTGPERLSQRDQVAIIGATVGRDIAITELDREQARERVGRFTGAAEAEAILQFLDDADAGNSLSTETVSHLLGREATSFGRWASDHRADFA